MMVIDVCWWWMMMVFVDNTYVLLLIHDCCWWLVIVWNDWWWLLVVFDGWWWYIWLNVTVLFCPVSKEPSIRSVQNHGTWSTWFILVVSIHFLGCWCYLSWIMLSWWTAKVKPLVGNLTATMAMYQKSQSHQPYFMVNVKTCGCLMSHNYPWTTVMMALPLSLTMHKHWWLPPVCLADHFYWFLDGHWQRRGSPAIQQLGPNVTMKSMFPFMMVRSKTGS